MNIHEEVAKAILEGGDWWYGFEWYDEHELPEPMWRGFLSPKQVFHTLADPRFTVRKKKKYITINGIDVPEPVREPLEYGTVYWLVNLVCEDIREFEWEDSNSSDRLWLRNGLIHLSEEAAKAHYDALLKANNS